MLEGVTVEREHLVHKTSCKIRGGYPPDHSIPSADDDVFKSIAVEIRKNRLGSPQRQTQVVMRHNN